MVTDEQVKLLRQKRMENKTQQAAAAMAGMSVRTARKWEAGMLPSADRKRRHWRTRRDPFEDVWASEVLPLLERDTKGKLEAKTVFKELRRQHPGQFDPGQLRTLQRRVRDWRAMHGPSAKLLLHKAPCALPPPSERAQRTSPRHRLGRHPSPGAHPTRTWRRRACPGSAYADRLS
jgi:helix-turn-helix protein